MHFDKSPKEKACCSLPTVKNLLEDKRRRKSSPSVSLSAANNTSPVLPNTGTQLPPTEVFPCPGASSSSFSDMALSYGAWSPAQEPVLGYYPPVPGPSYDQDFNLPMSSGYSHQQQQQQQQQHVYTAADTMIYVQDCIQECVMPVSDPGPGSSWPPLGLSHSSHMGFGLTMDETKLERARMLLSEMDHSRASGQDEDGDTILHIYAAKGDREYSYAAAERLRELRKLDAKEHKGKTALLVAVTAEQPEIVQDLLSLGSEVNACDMNGQTALHLAVNLGFPRVLQVLLSARPAVNTEARNFEGMTPLHCAAISHSATTRALCADARLQGKAAEKLSCVQMLLNAGASLCSQEIKSNKTVLHLAVKEGNVELVRYLLSFPLANIKDFVNMKAHGHTALHMAAGLHDNRHQEEILQLLLSKGADPSIRNLENDQAAHLLQSGPQGEQLKLMLKRRSASARRRYMSLQDLE